MKKCILALLLALALSASAFAMEIPTETVVQNLNGSQQLIKTYTLSPEADPQELIEAPFELDGYLYTFADIVKTENRVEDHMYHIELVTAESETNDLSTIQTLFEPTLAYDDGLYSGTLTLDPSGVLTEPSGYTSKSRSVSEVKTIGPVDRNDMSYVPATTVKDGVTLNLSDVDWQIIGTDVAGDALAPATYQAVATYTGATYRKVPAGYTSTAEYRGEISYDRVESITYKVTYLGKPLDEDMPAASTDLPVVPARTLMDTAAAAVPHVLSSLGLLAIVVLTVLLVRSRREVRRFQETGGDLEEETEEEQE